MGKKFFCREILLSRTVLIFACVATKAQSICLLQYQTRVRKKDALFPAWLGKLAHVNGKILLLTIQILAININCNFGIVNLQQHKSVKYGAGRGRGRPPLDYKRQLYDQW